MIFNLMKPVPVQDEPTMYSYNGTVLPKLPEWDKTAYPYACITYIPTGGQTSFKKGAVTFVATDKPVFAGALVENFDGTYNILFAKSPVARFRGIGCDENGDYGAKIVEWECEVLDTVTTTKDAIGDADYFVHGFSPKMEGEYVLWTNHDIYTSDTGERYLTASEPVPIYE